jgi:hypothetical protein
MKRYEVKHLVFQGATKTARACIRELRGVPFSIKVLSWFPGVFARLFASRYLAVKASLKRNRPGSRTNQAGFTRKAPGREAVESRTSAH